MCLALWGRDAFSSSSLEVLVVVISLSEAKTGDNGVLPSRVVRVDPQLQWRQNCISFLRGGGQKARSGSNVAYWNKNGFSVRHPIFLTLLQPTQSALINR